MKKINFWEFREELKFLKSKKIFNTLNKTLESGEIFSLPLYPFIKKNEMEKIITEIKLFNNKN